MFIDNYVSINMTKIGVIIYQMIPIILGTLILAYSDFKFIGILSIIFGLSAIAFNVDRPCVKCCGGPDSKEYQDGNISARIKAVILFICSMGISLLVWAFVT